MAWPNSVTGPLHYYNSPMIYLERGAALLEGRFALPPCRLRPPVGELGLRGYALSRPLLRSLSLRPGNSSSSRRETLSIGFKVLVSPPPCYPNYQGLLDSCPGGLSPAEHASLRWTHNRTCGTPASGSRIRPHAFVHDTSCRHGVVLVEAAGGGPSMRLGGRIDRPPRQALRARSHLDHALAARVATAR